MMENETHSAVFRQFFGRYTSNHRTRSILSNVSIAFDENEIDIYLMNNIE